MKNYIWPATLMFLLAATAFTGLHLNQQSQLAELENRVNDKRNNAEYYLAELILKVSERSETTAAISVDERGKINWLNERAIELLPLSIGDNITKIMRDDDQEKHETGFGRKMISRIPGESLTDLICDGLTKSGWKKIRVQTWAVRTGGMGFVEVIE